MATFLLTEILRYYTIINKLNLAQFESSIQYFGYELSTTLINTYGISYLHDGYYVLFNLKEEELTFLRLSHPEKDSYVAG